jgi:HK97 family phage portal protein
VENFKTVFGTALYNQDFLSNFYKNGAAVSGVVTVPQSLTDDAYKRLSSSWQSRYGGAGNVGKTAILEQGATYNRTGLSPAEAGVGDAKKVTTADIARITGVPQFLLEDLDRATFNNIEHLGLLFVTYTILPLCQNIEAELSRKLLPEADQMNYEIRSDLHSLLRADTENRAKLIESMMKWGIINRDEARAIEGLNPIADGSGQAYYVPMNMIDPTKPTPEPVQPEPAQNEDDNDTEAA